MPLTRYADRYFAVEQDDGGDGYLRAGDEVLVLPLLADGRFLLIAEPSPAFGEPTIVLPGGEVEPGEAHAVTANRELQEEVGLAAGRLDALGELRPWSKYLRLRSFVFLARDLTPRRRVGDERHVIQSLAVTRQEIDAFCRADRLRDARVLAAVLLADRFLAPER